MKGWMLSLSLVVVVPTISGAAEPLYDPIKRAEKMMAQMDRNSDGAISLEEYLHPANVRFKRFDTNKDGSLGRAELYAYWKNKRKVYDNVNAWEGPTRAHFKRFDANKDDVITKDEYFAKSKGSFAEIDADKDGRITQLELNNHWQARSEEASSYDFSEKDDD